jgi:hypothetical protein
MRIAIVNNAISWLVILQIKDKNLSMQEYLNDGGVKKNFAEIAVAVIDASR